MRSPKLFRTAAAVSALLVLSACSAGPGGAGDDSTAAAPPGGDLVLARSNEPSSLVPTQVSDNAAIWTIEEIYDTLVVPSADGKTLDPGLAEKWTQSDDKLSWTFTLRDGVTFSDSTPLTSADVKFSIERNRDEAAAAHDLDSVITDIKTPDAKTIVLTTGVPWSPLPSTMGFYGNSIVPKDYGGKTVEQFGEAPVGSGPFAFDHWTKGSELKLVKNARYWDKDKPKLDSVTFKLVDDSNTRSTQLAGGQIQINQNPPYSTIAALQAQPQLKVNAFPSSEVDYLVFNTKHEYLHDVNVRQAIAQAIDKKAILSAVLFGNGTVASTFLSPAFWAHSDAPGPTFDVDAAKASLAKSAYPNGFETTLTTAAGNQDQSTIAQLMQANLAKIGVRVTLQTLDPSALRDARDVGNFDMALGLFTADTIDPDDIARYAGTDTIDGSLLDTGFRSDALVQLAESASADQNQDSRKKDYDQMQQIILDQAPYVPLYYAPFVYSWSNKVRDFHPGVTGNYFLKNVSLAK